MNKIDVYNIMSKIKGGEVNTMDIMSTSIRYGILILLLSISYNYMNNTNIQFIIFILLLILIVIGTSFLLHDVLQTKNIMDKMNTSDVITSITSNSSTFLTIFLGIIGINILIKIVSIILIIVVLNYGRKELNNKDTSATKKMSSYNSSIIQKYIQNFLISSMMMIALIILIFITYASEELRIIIKNITALALSAGIVGISIYEIYYSVMFLKVQQKNGLLYEITTKIETTI